MLAQKQPSFKECVIAHWSSVPAPKMYGTKLYTEDMDQVVLALLGGRRALYSALKVYREEYWSVYK